MQLNAIKQMERSARADPAVVSLGQGIPFQASDSAIRRAATLAIQEGKADCYSDPQGLVELRRVIAETLMEQHMRYTPDEILVTAGAIEGLSVALHSVVRPGRDEVILPTPVYSAYSRAIHLSGGVAVPVLLQERSGWQLDTAQLAAAITKRTSAILICNPNNPTGSVYPERTLRELAELAARHNLCLITDEVYGNMVYDNAVLFSPAMDARYRKHVVRIVSFSKDFALTGWRVGFVQADHSRMDELVAVHDTLVNCAPVVSQYAALAALEHRERILARNRTVYDRHRRLMTGYLDALGPKVSYVLPEGAYFCFVRVTGVTSSAQLCADLLREQKLAVVPGSDFGPGGEGHVRLCFGRSAGAIHEGMRRFSTFVRGRGTQ
ncbi:MAG TPA: pyridoxal phosphate-dependent aminotransferase [Candidatus Saccharimonadales bacterium]|nr:pyridoxal phosphate-dependent aminotransferase [Candidatus Saccharimonadales bacterium]